MNKYCFCDHDRQKARGKVLYSEKVDCVVIGAGVIGLAVARQLSLSGRGVIVLEREGSIGNGISSRNSEVIHAGIYYPADTLKARLCVRGKKLLYNYLRERRISYKQCGKIVVATQETEQENLEQIQIKALKSNVLDLQMLSKEEVRALEPDLKCYKALLSPSTGILDTHSYMLSLQADLEHAGGICVFKSQVQSLNFEQGAAQVHVVNEQDMSKMVLLPKLVVNAAGFDAFRLLRECEVFPQHKLPPLYFAKGNYFALNVAHDFKHLIYPVPEKAGLGIHLTLDMAGRARFGPDVEWVNHVDYTVNKERISYFYDAIRAYWPALPDHSLSPDYVGIRPKICDQHTDFADFVIQGPEDHGMDGLVNLLGIESPGLTASLAIGEYVRNMV